MHPFSPAVKRRPYSHYDRWRNESPVCWNASIGAWLVTGFAEAAFVLDHHETFSSRNAVSGPSAQDDDGFPSLMTTDQPRHNRLRALVAKAFAPVPIEDERGARIREVVAEQLDGIRGDTFHVVRDLASPLPVRMIAEIIGVESERARQFKEWADVIVAGTGQEPEDPARFRQAATQLSDYLMGQVALRRREPREDLVTRLTTARVDGQALTDEEVEAFLLLLLVAGTQSTTTLIVTAIRTLAERPALLRRVHADRTLVSELVEESLRYEAPVQGFYRVTTRDVELAGSRVAAGDAVYVMYAAANRDPAAFERPEHFELERDRRDHLAFGKGIHYCLGANLARVEAEIAVNGVLDHFATLRREPGFRIEWRRTPFFRSLFEYQVLVTRRR